MKVTKNRGAKMKLKGMIFILLIFFGAMNVYAETQEIDRIQLQQEDSEARELMKRVDKLADEGKLEEALALLEKTKTHVQTAKKLLKPDELSAHYENKLIEKEKKEENFLREVSKQQKFLEVDTYWMPPKPWEPEPALKGDIKKLLPIEERARKRVPLIDFKDATLKEVVEFLARVADVNIVIDEKAVPIDERVSVYLKDIPMIEALNFVLKAKKLTARIDENLILITSPDNLGQELEVRVYDVQDLVGKLHDFPATPFDFGQISKKLDDQAPAAGGGDKSAT